MRKPFSKWSVPHLNEGGVPPLPGEQLLRDREGYRNEVYLDTEGNPTVGWGHKVPGMEVGTVPFTQEQNDANLRENIQIATQAAIANVGEDTWARLNDAQKDALISQAYQLGATGQAGFKKMIEAVQSGDHRGVRREAQDSKWNKQTPKRVQDIVNAFDGSGATWYNPLHWNQGGGVPDLNDPTNKDTVPAMLTAGEFVLNKEASQMFRPQIEAMNNAGLQQRHKENAMVMKNMGGPLAPQYLKDGGEAGEWKSGATGMFDGQPYRYRVLPNGMIEVQKNPENTWYGGKQSTFVYNPETEKIVTDPRVLAEGLGENHPLTEKAMKGFLGGAGKLFQWDPLVKDILKDDPDIINEALGASGALEERRLAEQTAASDRMLIDTAQENLRNKLVDTGEEIFGQAGTKLMVDPTTGKYYKLNSEGELRPAQEVTGALKRAVDRYEARTGKEGQHTTEVPERLWDDVQLVDQDNPFNYENVEDLRNKGYSEPQVQAILENKYADQYGHQNWATEEGEQEMQDLIDQAVVPTPAPAPPVFTQEGPTSTDDIPVVPGMQEEIPVPTDMEGDQGPYVVPASGPPGMMEEGRTVDPSTIQGGFDVVDHSRAISHAESPYDERGRTVDPSTIEGGFDVIDHSRAISTPPPMTEAGRTVDPSTIEGGFDVIDHSRAISTPPPMIEAGRTIDPDSIQGGFDVVDHSRAISTPPSMGEAGRVPPVVEDTTPIRIVDATTPVDTQEGAIYGDIEVTPGAGPLSVEYTSEGRQHSTDEERNLAGVDVSYPTVPNAFSRDGRPIHAGSKFVGARKGTYVSQYPKGTPLYNQRTGEFWFNGE